jgi:acetyl-CoA carboxylase biotin carboxyl carrier protein
VPQVLLIRACSGFLLSSLDDSAREPSEKGDGPVAADPGNDAKGLDVRKIQALAALMTRHDLTLIDLRDGSLHLRIRRGHHGLPAVAVPPLPAAAAAPTRASNAAEGASPEKTARALQEIKSPTPGTFYAQQEPGAPPYVRVGSRVTPTTVVCKIEAMKIFNDITADCTGVITEVLVENKQPVEWGQVLFRVDPNA